MNKKTDFDDKNLFILALFSLNYTVLNCNI